MATTYIQVMDLPNISISEEQQKHANDRKSLIIGTTAIVKELIEKLAVKYPNWRFEASNTRTISSTETVITQYRAYENREELGFISLDYYTGKEAVLIGNSRVSKDMDRCNGRVTTKVPIALKHVEKYFFTKTPEEQVEANIAIAYQAIDLAERKARDINHQSYNEISEKLISFVSRQWESFVQQENVSDKGKEFLTVREAYRKINDIDGNKNDATIVMLVGEEYVIKRKTDVVKIKELDTETKKKVGMLKLLEEGTFNSFLGIKVNSNLFIIV